MSDTVIKILKPEAAEEGKSVVTAGDKDLVYSSEWDTFKVRVTAVGSATYNADSDQHEFLYKHSLGFYPLVWVYAKDKNGRWMTNHWLTQFAPNAYPDEDIDYVRMTVDIENVYVVVSASDTNPRTVRLYICENFI